MSFKEIYTKYKNGTANDKEKLQVFEEVEKYKTLTDDYLDNQSDDLYIKEQDDNDFSSGMDEKEIKTIRERERTRNIRLILIAVLIVCALLVVFKFAATPLMNKYVLFGPEKHTYSKSGYFSDLRIELETFTSLHAPFAKISDMAWESTGLGQYDLTVQIANRDDPYKPTYEYGYIKNGKVKLKPFSDLTTMWGGYFSQNDMSQKEIDEQNKEELAGLQDLDSDFTAARTLITLKNDIDMGELAKYIKDYDELTFEWAAILASDSRNRAPLFGMDLEGSSIAIHEDDKAKDGNYPGFTDIEYTKEGLESYLTEMVEFQDDNMELVGRIKDMKQFGSMWYGGVLEYFETDGIKSYGLIVKGRPSDIIKFYEDIPTVSISVRNVMLDVEQN